MQCDAAELRSPRTLWLPQSSQPSTSTPPVQIEHGKATVNSFRVCVQVVFCGCDGNAGGFPWKASLPRSSAPPLNIWMKSCSCNKGPVYQSAGCFSFFLLVPRRRFLLIDHHQHYIVSISHRPRNLCHFVLMHNSWGCGLGLSASRLQPLSYMRRLKLCEFCVTHKTQIETSVKFSKEQK